MRSNMRHVPANGNPDHDFMSRMIPRQHGAIGMAQLELTYGKSPDVRQIARKMIDARKKDITIVKKQLRIMRD